MTKKVQVVCAHCGSDDVVADAHAVWSVENQDWEVAAVYDKGHYCNTCDGEARLNEKAIQDAA